MKCLVCKKGGNIPGKTTVTHSRGDTTAVFKQVPAEVCEDCGEAYVDDNVTETLLELAEKIAKQGVEIDVRTYKAV